MIEHLQPRHRYGVDRRSLLIAGPVAAAIGVAGAASAQEKGPKMQAKAPTRTGYAEVDGLKLYYEAHGAPLAAGVTPLVLLHGGMMAIETAFARDLLPRLSATRTVIAIEQQGHGHTADRAGPITMDRVVDDTAGVLAHLGVRSADLVGHSFGAMIAVGMAVRHPQRVRSFTAISGTYNLEGMLPELVKMQRDPTHQPSAELMPLLPTEQDFAAWTAHYERTAPDPKAFMGVLAKMNAMLANWPGWTPGQLGAIKAPALLVIGDNDFTRIEHAAEMKRLIPGAQLAVLPGTTHMNIIARGSWLQPLIEARLRSAGLA